MQLKETLIQRLIREINDFISLYKREKFIFLLVTSMLVVFGLYLFVVKIIPVFDQIEKKPQVSTANIPGSTDMELPIFKSVKRATVAMVVFHEGNFKNPYDIIGAGFCIHPKGIIVTCRHVVDAFMEESTKEQFDKFPNKKGASGLQPIGPVKMNIPYAAFFDTESSKTEMRVAFARVGYVIAELEYDLAVIKLHPHERYSDGFPSLETEDYDNVYEGIEIATCGFPLGNYLKEQFGTVTSSFTKGIISSFIPGPNVQEKILKGFQLDLTATFGSSGGPVFSLESGKVLGVLQGGLKQVPGITKAEPIYPIVKGQNLQQILDAPLFIIQNKK